MMPTSPLRVADAVSIGATELAALEIALPGLKSPTAADYFTRRATASDDASILRPGATFPRRFGVEIELAPTVSLRRVSDILSRAVPGHAPEGHDVYDAKNRKWEVKYDEPNLEIATPILRTHRDLETLQRVVAALEASEVICNSDTGVHVHVDAKGIDARALTYLLSLVACHEHYIYAALQVEPTRRDDACRPLKMARVKQAVRAAPRTISDLASAFRVDPSFAKFVGLNLEPIFSNGYGTVEFRYFNGCLNPHVIGCYVGYAMALTHHAASPTHPLNIAPEAQATLPGLLATVGLGPEHPVSRLLCDTLQTALEEKVAQSPLLAARIRTQAYTGDAAHLLTMGVDAETLENALRDEPHADELFDVAVQVLRYVAIAESDATFTRLRKVHPTQRRPLGETARSILDNPRFANVAGTVFQQLCRMPEGDRLAWGISAMQTPIDVLVKYAPHNTPMFAYVFSHLKMQHTPFGGVSALAKRILHILEKDGKAALRATVAAIANTPWPHVDSGDDQLRGPLMLALLHLPAQDIATLAALTEPVMAGLREKHLDVWAQLLETLCETPAAKWKDCLLRLQTVMASPVAEQAMQAIKYGRWDPASCFEQTGPVVIPAAVQQDSDFESDAE